MPRNKLLVPDAFCDSDSDESTVALSVGSSVLEDNDVLLNSSSGTSWTSFSGSPMHLGARHDIIFHGKSAGAMDAFMRSLAKTDRNLLQYRNNLTFLGDTPKEILNAYDTEEAFERVIERYLEKGKLVYMKPSHMTIIWKKLSEWNVEAPKTFSPPAMFLPTCDLTTPDLGIAQTAVVGEGERFKGRSLVSAMGPPPGFGTLSPQPLPSARGVCTGDCAPKPNAWNVERTPPPALKTRQTLQISSYKCAVMKPVNDPSVPNLVCLAKNEVLPQSVCNTKDDQWTAVTRKERKPARKPRRRCDYYFKHGTCKHGDSCCYGHNEDEIDECRHGTLCTNKDTTCRFKHTQVPYCKDLRAGEQCPHHFCKFRGH